MRIDQIVVGERRREDMGDLDGLVNSIRRFGLLHPVIVDAAKRLVAGERRLRACTLLGWDEIPVKHIGSLSDAELREVEFEENLRRKDLTAYERSKWTVARVEAAREVNRDFVSTMDTKSNGRPVDPTSDKAASERAGIERPTFVRAKEHVAAVERYPELAPLDQSEALQIARGLDTVTDEVKPAKREAVRQLASEPRRTPAAVREVIAQIEESGGVQSARLKRRYSTAVHETRVHLFDVDAEAAAELLDQTEVLIARHFIADCRAWLDRLDAALSRGLRVVGE